MLTETKPAHIMLNPGKWKGALSDKNRANADKKNMLDSELFVIFVYSAIVSVWLPVRGLKARGETMLAKEPIPVMQPWTFP